jgi:hypothetical protein
MMTNARFLTTPYSRSGAPFSGSGGREVRSVRSQGWALYEADDRADVASGVGPLHQ